MTTPKKKPNRKTANQTGGKRLFRTVDGKLEISSRKELAEILGVAQETVRLNYEAQGMPRCDDGWYCPAKIIVWLLKNNRSWAAKAAVDAGDGTADDLNTLRAEKIKEETRKIRYANEKAEGILIAREEAFRTITELALTMSATLAGVPEKVASYVPGRSKVTALRESRQAVRAASQAFLTSPMLDDSSIEEMILELADRIRGGEAVVDAVSEVVEPAEIDEVTSDE